MLNSALEQSMDEVLRIVVMGRACRNSAGIKNRQPIGQMFVKAPEALEDFYQDIIREELNVKKLQFTNDVRDFTSYSFKPQMRTVGPKYGRLLNDIKKALTELNGNEAMDQLNAAGELHLDISGTDVVLTRDDLLIDTAQMPGYISENDRDLTVVMDTNLTPELIEEGFVREIMSKIQTMRKEAGFEVTDHIRVYLTENEKLTVLAEKYADEIKGGVLADSIVIGALNGYTKEWNINGEQVALGVEKTQA